MQILRFDWTNFEPSFVLENNERINLFRTPLSIEIGEKFCTGYWKNGYHPCPEKRKISSGTKCFECMKQDDYHACIRCNGGLCNNPDKRNACRNDIFYIYLAAFDSLLKVGVSRAFRLTTRFVEQGCDFAAKILQVQDGKRVRELEQRIRKKLNITDRVMGGQKFLHLFGDPNKAVSNINNAITALNGSMEFSIRPEIYDMRKYYKLDMVTENPILLKKVENVNLGGQVVAAKGNILVMKTTNPEDFGDICHVAINAHDLLGREIKFV